LRGLAGIPLLELSDELNMLYQPCCHVASLPNLAAEDDFTSSLLNMIQQVWKDKGMPEGSINKEVTTEFAKRLFNGVQEGFGQKITDLDYTTPDWNMLTALQRNVWQFSAAKNYTQLRELSNALIGDDGKLRTYQQFKQAAFEINDKHINQYLKAEYNLAVAGGQMAGKWVDIESNADTLPYLEFDAVIDGQTTELCRSLNGTVLPIDHPFWKTYYPPNHFFCRSTVRQRPHGPATPAHSIPSADIPDMFKTNLAQHRLIFPKDHAYFKDLPSQVDSMPAMRSDLKQLALQKYRDKKYKVEGIGDVVINKTSINKIAAQPLAHDKIPQLQLLNVLPQVLRNAELIKTSEAFKTGGEKWYYCKVTGLKKLFVAIRETNTGELQLYTITDRI
jgi:SPP1 gp7 family putative phage head morphogenesis protein